MEVGKIITTTEDCGVFGTFLGVGIHSSNAYKDFMHNNRASQFSSHLDAKAELTGRLQSNMIRGAFYWSLRSVAIGFTFS